MSSQCREQNVQCDYILKILGKTSGCRMANSHAQRNNFKALEISQREISRDTFCHEKLLKSYERILRVCDLHGWSCSFPCVPQTNSLEILSGQYWL